MKGRLHIILGTPNSERRSILSKFLSKHEQSDPFCFLLAPELDSLPAPHSNWAWSQNNFELRELSGSSEVDFFLFFSNQIDLANQFEAILKVLAEKEDLSMGRIILFINSTMLQEKNPEITAWIDAAGHFSDAICFTHRKNENAMAISQCKERFEAMKYPLETYILGGKSSELWIRSSTQIPGASLTFLIRLICWKKMTLPENDPYLSKLANGKRVRPIPTPFQS